MSNQLGINVMQCALCPCVTYVQLAGFKRPKTEGKHVYDTWEELVGYGWRRLKDPGDYMWPFICPLCVSRTKEELTTEPFDWSDGTVH